MAVGAPAIRAWREQFAGPGGLLASRWLDDYHTWSFLPSPFLLLPLFFYLYYTASMEAADQIREEGGDRATLRLASSGSLLSLQRS